MGLLNTIRMTRYASAMAAAETALSAAAPGPVVPQLGSPFVPHPNHLQSIIWSDILGGDFTSLSRAAAMSLPAMARQRHLLAGTIARLPLVRFSGPNELPAPLWATRTDGELSPFHRMLWTVDDLIFYGWSLWSAVRAPDDSLQVGSRIAFERWEADPVGRILVDGEPAQDGSVILIPGPHEGVLSFGSKVIRQGIANADAAANAARNPSAYLELHYTGDAELTDDYVDALIARWAAARRGENGGVSFTGKNLEIKEHGTHESHLLIEGRNADAVDVSRLVSSPAAMADATSAGSSLTYETTTGRNSEFIDYGIALYMSAVEARLSMDDVVATGERMAFDTSTIRDVAAPATETGPNRED